MVADTISFHAFRVPLTVYIVPVFSGCKTWRLEESQKVKLESQIYLHKAILMVEQMFLSLCDTDNGIPKVY